MTIREFSEKHPDFKEKLLVIIKYLFTFALTVFWFVFFVKDFEDYVKTGGIGRLILCGMSLVFFIMNLVDIIRYHTPWKGEIHVGTINLTPEKEQEKGTN